MTNPVCPYCQKPAELVGGEAIYPHRRDLFKLWFWLCNPCGAYTGTHANSPTHAPKGGLALAPLRQARIEAHAAFDGRWKSKQVKRADAYRWLRDQLGMTEMPHIGFMNEAECARVVELCREEHGR